MPYLIMLGLLVVAFIITPWAVANGWPLLVLIPLLWGLFIYIVIHNRKDTHHG